MSASETGGVSLESGDPGAVLIDVEAIYRALGETALVEHLPTYERAAREQAGEGAHVVVTGRGPIWLYLRLAHALHGVARTLTYRSPEAGDVVVFDHTSVRQAGNAG